MEEHKNKLVIIGNGFDLAHGLKTSYNDFIDWYVSSMFINTQSESAEAEIYEDRIIKIDFNLIYKLNYNSINLDWFHIRRKEGKFFKVSKISPFLDLLFSKKQVLRWVDIEKEFYQSLINIFVVYKEFPKERVNTINKLYQLNIDFEYIKNKLKEYLTLLNYEVSVFEIEELFKNIFGCLYHWEANSRHIHYLNFNYTHTFEKYIPKDDTKYHLNYIHGELNNHHNPIIFGYGDEIDKYYEEIQNLNINEFLNNFKSFGYFKTENYSNLLRFIESEPFNVEILGHSCGLSDRVLLNTIFEHDNCESIRIHYYQKSETEDDFLSKTQEISRHFKDKAKMRKRIVNFKDCKPLVKFKSQSK